ncbi:hypothetical protein GCM10010331_44820 [Streptomyces xanthochromogenes]|uniref:hypothetical protein n=1 Tax=Streptomyces xanthochromogenes TaxID=67384 RepID=UPI001679403C|nr:hypothetical protein [Streptomyces xanthochromogenes]GHB52272.1 hypothetical protein GCM10010331_44820 [Streptomyces xanthochromogenes]
MVHRDRQGQEVTSGRWADLRSDWTYCVVAEDEAGGTQVRTMWEGIDDVIGAMFTTGISRDGGRTWQTRHEDARTEGEALSRHREVTEKIRNLAKTSF